MTSALTICRDLILRRVVIVSSLAFIHTLSSPITLIGHVWLGREQSCWTRILANSAQSLQELQLLWTKVAQKKLAGENFSGLWPSASVAGLGKGSDRNKKMAEFRPHVMAWTWPMMKFVLLIYLWHHKCWFTPVKTIFLTKHSVANSSVLWNELV